MTTRNFRVKNGLSVGDITISASANTITGLATAAPSADGDVANKKYVDDQDANIASDTLTFTNKTFDANGTGNSLSNVEVADFAGSAIINVSETLASNDSDTALVTAGAIIDYVDAQDANIAGDTLTFTNKTFDANGTGNSISNIDFADFTSGVVADEDNMASNSATKLATQQSIKAYVDAEDANIASDTLTLTNKTFDANGTGNSISNIEVADFAGSAIITVAETLASNDSDSALVTAGAIIDYVDAQDAAIASDTLTLTNKTFDANGTGNSISNIEVADFASGVLDTDLSSVAGTDTTLASAKAIKSYVDAQVTAQDLDFQADSGGALAIDLDSESLTFTGGTGIDTSGSGNAVTFAIDSTVATLTGSQTLTNKTINLTSNTLTGTFSQFNTAVSDATLVSTSSTDTLTNKTINSASNTITITESNISDLGSYITASSTDTLTNKTFDANGTGNSISNIETADFASAAFKDEDNMASDSATAVASQQSIKAYVDAQDANIASDTLTFTNKTFDANGTGNSISNIEVADLAAGVLDTDLSSVAGTDTTLASAKAIKAYVDNGLSSLSSTTITEGNTSVVVADSGTGSITATVDGATVATFQPGDLALPNNVGLLFGTGGEKIESDGTNLTITSTGALDLTATGTTTVTNNFDVGGNMVISGDLTVQGTETIIATQNLNIEDAIIGLNSNVSDPNNMPRFSGIHLHRGNTSVATEVDLYMVWDDATNASGSTTNLGGCFTFMGSVHEAGSESPNSGSFILADVKASTIEANLTGNVTGNLTGAVTGNADTATALETARLIGGVSFNGTANINLPGVNTAGNQNTSGTAAIATTVTAADESSDTSCNVLFVTAATGNLPPKTGTNLTFNSSNGTLTATTFSGSGASLTTLNGSNISSGTVAAARVATLNQNTTGSSGSCTGNSATATTATNVTVSANNTANETVYLTFVDGATGTQGIETDTGLSYNPSTNVLSTTASAAQYADVAERFEADAPMEIGTVVEVGGTAEITEATSEMSQDVFGVISHKPAYMMNAGAGDDETHPFVAMTGRTPVRVVGAVTKGQRLVTSSTKGCARAAQPGESISPFNVIGRALETNTETGIKLVNCAVRTNN